jgi:hypothetical protein
MIKSKPQTVFLSISRLCLKASSDESRGKCNNKKDIFGTEGVNNSLSALRRMTTWYLSQESVFVLRFAA